MRTFGRIITALVVLGIALGGSAQAVEIRIATLAPADSQWMQDMRAGAERIRAATDGRVELKFRAGGVAGSDDQVMRKIRLGDLQGGAFSAGGLGSIYPGMNIYGIPLVFRSLDEVDHVRARLDDKLMAGLEENGFVSFGFSEGGFSNLLSNEPVTHINDLRRKKVWVPTNDTVSHEVLQTLRLAPVPLEVADALLGLERGLVDVVAASPVVALVLQWHTKVKYRTDLPVSYSMGVLAIDAKVFDRLQDSDQRIVREILTEVMAGIDASARQDNVEAMQVMADMGIETVSVNDSDVEAWRTVIREQFPQIRGMRDVDGNLFAEMIALLDDLRSN